MIVFFLMTRISVKLMNQMARNVTINQYPQIKVENKMILALGMTRRFWMSQVMNMRLQKHRWTKKHAHLTRGHWRQIRSLSKQFLVDLFQEMMQLVFSRKSSVCNKKIWQPCLLFKSWASWPRNWLTVDIVQFLIWRTSTLWKWVISQSQRKLNCS